MSTVFTPKDRKNRMSLKSRWNNGIPLLNRLLWANIESLPKKLFDRLLVRYTAMEYLRHAEFDKLERVAALNDKRSKPIDLITRLTEIGDSSDHNSFHFEVLSFARNTKNKALARHFKKRLKAIDKLLEHNLVP